ncbi:MAG: hypothetical protein ACYCOR_20690 [Acidobacteriaceae bacterium]
MAANVAYGCWSNERHIVMIPGFDAGIIRPELFTTLAAAKQYFATHLARCPDDVLVRVTVETAKVKE